MTLHAHILNMSTTASLDELRVRLHPSVHLTDGTGLIDPQSIALLITGFPKRSDLDACPQLQALIAPFAGVPAETCALLRDYPNVTLHSLHYNVTPTAEMAVALLLAAAKVIPPLDRALRCNDWTGRYGVTPATTLAGKTALILGYGMIGRRIAPVCQALGMRVIGVKRHAPTAPDDHGVAVHPVDHLHRLLPEVDALIVALPETPETTGIIGAVELAMLRPGAIVVNVGRGPTIDEEALYLALRNGVIRSAGIDVWYHYPQTKEARNDTPPSRFPFHELDNVVMSPHRAGWLSEAEHDRLAGLAEMINAAAAGREIPGLVDKVLGY
jgi:phosphoglycerate dehydrogenase-like enzyme